MNRLAGFARGIHVIPGGGDLGLARGHHNLETAAEIVVRGSRGERGQGPGQVQAPTGLAFTVQGRDKISRRQDPIDQLEIGIVRKLRLHQGERPADMRRSHRGTR